MITGGMVTLYVTDMKRALGFYTGVLGLELAYRSGPGWAVVRSPDGFSVGLHDSMGSAPVGEEGSSTVGFHVDRPLEETVEELSEAGVEFQGELTRETAVPLAYFRDPDGNVLYLAEARGVGARSEAGSSGADGGHR